MPQHSYQKAGITEITWILEGSVPLFHDLGLAICIGCACVSFWPDVAGWMWVTAKNHPRSGPPRGWTLEVCTESDVFTYGWSHPLGSYLWPHSRAICCQVFFEDDGHSSKYQRGVAAMGRWFSVLAVAFFGAKIGKRMFRHFKSYEHYRPKISKSYFNEGRNFEWFWFWCRSSPDPNVNWPSNKSELALPGSFSKIQFSWRDADRVLTVSDRLGSFPGMDLEKNLCIVFVSEGHGVGVSRAKCDKEVVYSGHALQIAEDLALFAWKDWGDSRVRVKLGVGMRCQEDTEMFQVSTAQIGSRSCERRTIKYCKHI